ncbi:MAG TPA: hypothetical protein VNU72_04285 [Puia sp.]|jgi:hypothetical protein|nr:hypothetical protein [Puia sp.]
MISDEIRAKLQNIVRGTRLEGSDDRCSTVRDILIEGFGANTTVKGEFESRSIVKEKQVGFLKTYATSSGLWLQSLPVGTEYLTRGGESRIYLDADMLRVIKINDAVYYATWTEYFNSLVLHNLLFPNTAWPQPRTPRPDEVPQSADIFDNIKRRQTAEIVVGEIANE